MDSECRLPRFFIVKKTFPVGGSRQAGANPKRMKQHYYASHSPSVATATRRRLTRRLCKGLAALILLALPQCVQAQTYIERDGITYRYSGRYCTVYSAQPDIQEAHIKDTLMVNGRTANVRQIGNEAFSGCSRLKTVVFPSPESDYYRTLIIGTGAFKNCTALESIELQANLSAIGNGVFQGCSSLKRIGIQGQTGQADAQLPSAITSIGDSTFWGCTALKSFRLPESISTVSPTAFGGGCRLEVLSIPSSYLPSGNDWSYAAINRFETYDVDGKEPVCAASDGWLYSADMERLILVPSSANGSPLVLSETISDFSEGAFNLLSDIDLKLPASWVILNYDNKKILADADIKRLSVPATFENLSQNMLSSSLKSIEVYDVPGKEPAIRTYGGAVYMAYLKMLLCVPNGTTIELPAPDEWENTVMASELNSAQVKINIKVPASWTTYSDAAISPFSSYDVDTLFLPSTIQIEDDAYVGRYPHMEMYTVEGTPGCVLEDGILYNADRTEVISGSSDLKGNLTLPASVRRLRPYCFSRTQGLTSVVLPEGLTEVAERAFYSCLNLSSVTLPGSLRRISKEAFWGTALTQIHLPVALDSLAFDAFYGCSALASFTIDEGNEHFSVVDDVVYDKAMTRVLRYAPARKATHFSLPQSVKHIGICAFDNARNLQTLELPESLETIGESAFSFCFGLRSLVVPPTVKLIGGWALGPSRNLCVELSAPVDSIGPSQNNQATGLSFKFNVAVPPAVNNMSGLTVYVPKGFFPAYQKSEEWQDVGYYDPQDYSIEATDREHDVLDDAIYRLVTTDTTNTQYWYIYGLRNSIPHILSAAAIGTTLEAPQNSSYSDCYFTLTGTGNNSFYISNPEKQKYLKKQSYFGGEPEAWDISLGSAAPISTEGMGLYRINGSSPRLAEIATATKDYFPFTLYRRQGDLTIRRAEGFTTFYAQDNCILPEGLQGAVVVGVGADTLQLNYLYKPGSVVPRGTALLISGDPGTYHFYYTAREAEAPAVNYLRQEANDADAESTDPVYRFATAESGEALGFYRDGEAFKEDGLEAGGYGIYLRLPSDLSPASHYVLKSSPATGIDKFTPTSTQQEGSGIYTLDGRRVSGQQPLAPGIYIKDGRKVIVR